MGAKEQSGRTWPSIFWARGTKDKEKHSDDFLKNLFFAEFCSLLKLRMGYSETHEIPEKERFFLRNNEKRLCIIRGIFSDRNFDGNPRVS